MKSIYVIAILLITSSVSEAGCGGGLFSRMASRVAARQTARAARVDARALKFTPPVAFSAPVAMAAGCGAGCANCPGCNGTQAVAPGTFVPPPVSTTMTVVPTTQWFTPTTSSGCRQYYDAATGRTFQVCPSR